jgi:hypothetical protein
MKRIAIIALALLASTSTVWADAPRVGIATGVVYDPDGQPMPGVTVQLISNRGTETAITDADGVFKFGFVIPGEYTVRADIPGYQSAVGTIGISAGGRSDVQLVLTEVAGEEIVITGEAPLVNKFDVAGGGSIDAREIENIVAPSRSYQTMLQWFSGTTPSQEPGMFLQDIEGNSAYRNAFYVEGVDTSHGRYGGTSTIRLPNMDVGQLQLAARPGEDGSW